MVEADLVPSWDGPQCNPCMSRVGKKSPSKSVRFKAVNSYISFAQFPAPLPRFWHFSEWTKLFILGEALTQNFKKSQTQT